MCAAGAIVISHVSQHVVGGLDLGMDQGAAAAASTHAATAVADAEAATPPVGGVTRRGRVAHDVCSIFSVWSVCLAYC